MVNFASYNNIINTGKSDALLLANELLQQNLNKIKEERKKNNLDPLPTLGDIEDTHVMYTVAQFKPHVAITHQYLKESASFTKNCLGSDIRIQISQFGDFFHDMVLNIQLNYSNNAESYINIVEDPATDLSLNSIPKYKFCDYPGERIIKKCSFVVNGKKLDEYHSSDMTFWRQFNLSDEGKRGWGKLLGQEEIKQTKIMSHILNSAVFTTPPFPRGGIPHLSDISSIYMSNKKYLYDHKINKSEIAHYKDGLQTLKFAHKGPIDLWIPLIFWFNKDIRTSIPSMCIPNGNRHIDITLANEDEIIGLYPSYDDLIYNKVLLTETSFNNLDLYKNINKSYGYSGTNFLIYDLDNWNNCDSIKNYKDTCNNLEVTKIDLYTNHLFIDPQIHEIFVKRIGFNLIRVHKRQIFKATNANDTFNVNKMKWPIETMYFGMRLQEYETANTIYFDVWNKFGFYPSIRILQTDMGLNYDNIYYPTIDNISLSSRSIKLMDNFPYKLYTDYIPWKFRSNTSNLSKNNDGASMISFAMYPGRYQPSGHINISRATDFHINYISNIIGQNPSKITNNSSKKYLDDYYYNNFRSLNWWPKVYSKRLPNSDGILYVSAIAINFLIISEDSVELRFSV
tara:strand:- start:3494 stop:5365 length:1872 start_codon:yes stop_codon:yes gene_type:complete